MFDLSQASEGNVSSNYQKPGIYDNVVISEVVLEETSRQKVPYLRLVTKDTDGAIGSSVKMFLGTETKEGKQTSGFAITARNIVDLIIATHNIEEAAAKAMIKVATPQELVDKTAALLVGKPFRCKFKGTYTAKNNIYAEIGQVESMRIETTRMNYKEARDIKPYQGPVVVNTTESIAGPASDMPF